MVALNGRKSLYSAFRLNFLRKELVCVPEFFVALIRKNTLVRSPERPYEVFFRRNV